LAVSAWRDELLSKDARGSPRKVSRTVGRMRRTPAAGAREYCDYEK
jgi:hypothetical protein